MKASRLIQSVAKDISYLNGPIIPREDTARELERILDIFAPIRKDPKATEDAFERDVRNSVFCRRMQDAYEASDAVEFYEVDGCVGCPSVINEYCALLLSLIYNDRYSFGYLYELLLENTRWLHGCDRYRDGDSPFSPDLIAYAVDFDRESISERMVTMTPSEQCRYASNLLARSQSMLTVTHKVKDDLELSLAAIIDSTANRPMGGPKQFASFLVSAEDAVRVVMELHKFFDGKKGKHLAIAVNAAKDAGVLNDLPSFEVLKNEFSVDGSHSGYEKFQYNIDTEDVGYIELLKLMQKI